MGYTHAGYNKSSTRLRKRGSPFISDDAVPTKSICIFYYYSLQSHAGQVLPPVLLFAVGFPLNNRRIFSASVSSPGSDPLPCYDSHSYKSAYASSMLLLAGGGRSKSSLSSEDETGSNGFRYLVAFFFLSSKTVDFFASAAGAFVASSSSNSL